MATEAARLHREKSLVRKRKTDLTLTGLLMVRTWPSETSRFLSLGSRPHTAPVINLHIDFSVRLRLVLTEGHFPSSRWKGRIGSHSHR